MNILHISAGEVNDGGAAKGAFYLHQALLTIDVDSFFFCNGSEIKNEKIGSSQSYGLEKYYNFFRSKIDKSPLLLYPNRDKNQVISTGITGFDFTKTSHYEKADIIHLHWINSGFINIKHLKKINKPIIWSLRDLWPMTGSCHYPIECTSYKTGCGSCPILGSSRENDLSKFVLKRKKKYLPKKLVVVGHSPWVSKCASESMLFENSEIHTIPVTVNTKIFKKIDKNISREKLKINNKNKKIILAGVNDLNSWYKGFKLFVDSLYHLDSNEFMIITFGKNSKSFVPGHGLEHKGFGFINNEKTLNLLYSSADVYVLPSKMDAFPKTIIESMVSGTPTVCFDTSGPGSIISHLENGYKAKPFCPLDLAKGIKKLAADFDDTKSKIISENAIKKYSNKVVAHKWKDLYEKLLLRTKTIKNNNKIAL